MDTNQRRAVDRAVHISAHLNAAQEHFRERGIEVSTDTLRSALAAAALPVTASTEVLSSRNPSPFLQGNFKPVRQEMHKTGLSVIQGAIPADLNGEYIKNGPNAFLDPGADKTYHWFDGDGMLHGIYIRNGQAEYINKWTRTRRFVGDNESGESIYEFGELEQGNLGALMEVFDPETGFRAGRAQTSVIFHDGRLLVLDESDLPYHAKVPSLETVGQYNYGGQLSHVFTAHPKIDGRNGELHVFGYTITPTPPYEVQYTRVTAAGQMLPTINIEIREPVFMHDFAITENHAIFFDIPARFKFDVGDGRSPWVHEPDTPSMFGIIPRNATDGKAIKWFETGSCMIFHTYNAWEEGNRVHLVVCRADSYKMNFDAVEDSRVWLYPYEWCFDLTTGKVAYERRLTEVRCDFPMVNPAYVGYKSRYFYGASYRPSPDKVPYYDGLVKIDLQTTQTTWLQLPSHQACAEWQYISRPNPTAEDDGYLVSFVFDEILRKCFFFIVDAANPSLEKPVAIVECPQRVPYGFHGTWIDQKAIAASRTE